MNLVLLLATLLALLSGPLLYAVARDRAALLAFLDGFVLVAICGLVALEVLPEAFADGGWASLSFLVAGALGPTLFEHQLHRLRREAHVAALLLAVAGLVLHSIADGAALAPSVTPDAQLALGLAIAVHSVPVGLVVWWLMYPVFGARLPTFALAAMCGGTLAGYLFGGMVSVWVGAQGWAWFQALVAGSILHVIFGRPHLDDASEHRVAQPPFEGLGNLAALAGLVAIESLHLHGGDAQHPFIERLLQLALASAPALLAAYLVGGLVGSALPQQRLAGGGAAGQALRGGLLGLRLPVASAEMLSRYRQLQQDGVPLPAAIALFVAASQLGLVALFVSLPLLGLEMTLLRVAAAVLLAWGLGWLLARVAQRPPAPRFVAAFSEAPLAPAHDGCAQGHGHGHGHGHHHHHRHPPRLHGGPAAAATESRLRGILRLGLVDLVDGTAAWIVAGLVLAALALPYVAQGPWASLPAGAEVVLFALLGVPLHVCAAGITPLVAVLIAGGVSPGAGLAFLMTGPAANLAAFGMLRMLHGPRFAALFVSAAVAAAVLAGFAANAWLPAAPALAEGPPHAATPLQLACLAALGLAFAAALLRRGGRHLFGGLFEPAHPAGV